MILQIRSVCGFVFTLVTGVLRFIVSCLYVLLWFTLGVVLYSHWLQGYHDSLQVQRCKKVLAVLALLV